MCLGPIYEMSHHNSILQKKMNIAKIADGQTYGRKKVTSKDPSGYAREVKCHAFQYNEETQCVCHPSQIYEVLDIKLNPSILARIPKRN